MGTEQTSINRCVRTCSQRVRSIVHGRLTLTLVNPVNHELVLTLSNPVGYDFTLLFLPTTVLFLFSQHKRHHMPLTVLCAHSYEFPHELVWFGCRVVLSCHLVR